MTQTIHKLPNHKPANLQSRGGVNNEHCTKLLITS